MFGKAFFKNCTPVGFKKPLILIDFARKLCKFLYVGYMHCICARTKCPVIMSPVVIIDATKGVKVSADNHKIKQWTDMPVLS